MQTQHDCHLLHGVIDNHVACLLQDDATAAQVRRTLQQRLNDPLLVAFGPAPSAAGNVLQQLRHSSMAQALPLNVHLLTMKALEDGSTLLRLAHLYQVRAGAGDCATGQGTACRVDSFCLNQRERCTAISVEA